MSVKFKDMDKKSKFLWLRVYYMLYGMSAFWVCVVLAGIFTLWFLLFGVGLYLILIGLVRGIDKDLFEYYKKYGTEP